MPADRRPNSLPEVSRLPAASEGEIDGDTTCGLDQNAAPQAGELSPYLHVWISPFDCTGGIELVQYEGRIQLDALASSAVALGQLGPGQDRCFNIMMNDTARDPAAQLAQSEKATWRFAFDGAVPST